MNSPTRLSPPILDLARLLLRAFARGARRELRAWFLPILNPFAGQFFRARGRFERWIAPPLIIALL